MAAPLIAAGAVSVAKLLKMLNSASKTKKGKHDPKEMWGMMVKIYQLKI